MALNELGQHGWRMRAWRAIAMFAYRRWRRYGPSGIPVGVPFNRDPDNVCRVYEPGEARDDDWVKCQTDGHYLCEECCHREPPEALGAPQAEDMEIPNAE